MPEGRGRPPLHNLVADAPLWCLNSVTQKELEARRVEKFVFSFEDEYLNIRNTVVAEGISGIVPVYGKPPLFISRMPTPVKANTPITDMHGNEFFVAVKNDLYYTLPQTPVCLFAKREKLSGCGIENFLIDLCFHDPDYETVNKLLSGFKDGVKVEKSTMFNFKAGFH